MKIGQSLWSVPHEFNTFPTFVGVHLMDGWTYRMGVHTWMDGWLVGLLVGWLAYFFLVLFLFVSL
jgi:hypothetical protein